MSAIFVFTDCPATAAAPVCCAVAPHWAQKGLLEAGGGVGGVVVLLEEPPPHPPSPRLSPSTASAAIKRVVCRGVVIAPCHPILVAESATRVACKPITLHHALGLLPVTARGAADASSPSSDFCTYINICTKVPSGTLLYFATLPIRSHREL